MTDTAKPAPVTARDIADLLAWARALTGAGQAVNPAEQAAYLHAKAQLLSAIADTHTGDWPHDRVADARQAAQAARAAADTHTAQHPAIDKEQ
ncbi:MAG: hypothetical protein ACRDN9_20165 [Streptosporangiaceae bacterium]